MKIIRLLSLLVLVLTISSFTKAYSDLNIPSKSAKFEREFYQIKTYILKTDQQVETTDKYLKEAYIPGLKKIGIKSIGVFKPIKDENDSIKKIIVLIPFSSMAQFLSIDEKLAKDKTYLAVGADYLNTLYTQPTFNRIESILLKAFSDHPVLIPSKLNDPRANRVYELRSYESATEAYYRNKVDMFNAGGEIKLFNRLECNAVFYGEVISGPKMPNLMYMTTYDNLESRDAHWKAFSDSPEWKALIAMEKYKNNISHIDKYFLYPTEYSDY
ncbi:MAG: NIPSNAP family protein [Flavobacterium sp.]|uniref:NIPSNAP family protein n=1 Tax=Flavobacterium sp. TaxID=239 RepID=UPI002616A62E|nr:NIPSNAP family protein [Flavobacterium sp.]MDD5150546.1 NIPSNAP family protein [Flavobacterium sp.]